MLFNQKTLQKKMQGLSGHCTNWESCRNPSILKTKQIMTPANRAVQMAQSPMIGAGVKIMMHMQFVESYP